MNAPFYLPYYVLIGSLGIIAVLMLGLARALERADWPAADRRPVLVVSGAVLVGWFVAVIALGRGGAFEAGAERIPTIQFGIFLPVVIGAWFLWRSPTVRRTLDAVPQSWIVGVQLYRALGVISSSFMPATGCPGSLPGPRASATFLSACSRALSPWPTPDVRKRTRGRSRRGTSSVLPTWRSRCPPAS